jgi:hypothetical protein
METFYLIAAHSPHTQRRDCLARESPHVLRPICKGRRLRLDQREGHTHLTVKSLVSAG